MNSDLSSRLSTAAGTSANVTLNYGDSVTCTIHNVQASLVTSSSLCTFDTDAGTAGNQFRLLFTPDPAKPHAYKQNASNPGQFYYNVFYSAPAGTSVGNPVKLTLNIPYPFVTQGAQPVHIYDGADTTFTNQGGQTCIIPGTGLGQVSDDEAGIVLSEFVPQQFGSSTTVDVLLTAPGAYYVNIHLDYGLKKTGNYAKSEVTAPNAGCPDAPAGRTCNNAVDFDAPNPVRIPDFQPYSFTATDNILPPWDPVVVSRNEFKKNPGVGGNTTTFKTNSAGEVVLLERMRGGLPVEIYQGNKKLGTTATDADGWYMWSYKYTGRPTTLTIKLKQPNSVWTSKDISLKSNGFVVVDFNYKLP